MKTHITIIPSDSFISVDGEGMFFTFPLPANIHAIQWHNGSGHIEHTDGTLNTELFPSDYESSVAPYVTLWEAEKARREEEASRPPTLDEARTAKLDEVMALYAASFVPVEAVYPANEREGWPTQEAEARAVLADPEADTAVIAPVLSTLAQLRNRGETVAALAAEVLEKANQWRGLYAHFTGQQQRMYAAVSALATVREIQAYRVEYALPEGM